MNAFLVGVSDWSIELTGLMATSYWKCTKTTASCHLHYIEYLSQQTGFCCCHIEMSEITRKMK